MKLMNIQRQIADLELGGGEYSIVGTVAAHSAHNTKVQSEHAILVG